MSRCPRRARGPFFNGIKSTLANIKWVICDMSLWQDSIYIPKAQSSLAFDMTNTYFIETIYIPKAQFSKIRISCTWVMCMRKGVYVSQKPNLKLLDYMYCENLTCIRLTIYIPKANPPKSRTSCTWVTYNITHSDYTEWVICDKSTWHAYVTCDMTQYTVQSLECHVHDSSTWKKEYMYPESLTYIRLTIYIPKGQSSQVSNVMYMSHVWHDSFTLHRMSHMWNAYVTCDMTQYTVQSLECHVHESCVTWIHPRSIERVIHQMTCVPWLNINPESPVPQSLESHIYQHKWVSHPVCAYRCDVEALFVHIEVTTSALAPSQHVIPQWHSALTICSNRVTNQPIVSRITDLVLKNTAIFKSFHYSTY